MHALYALLISAFVDVGWGGCPTHPPTHPPSTRSRPTYPTPRFTAPFSTPPYPPHHHPILIMW